MLTVVFIPAIILFNRKQKGGKAINYLYELAEKYIVQILNCYTDMQRKKHTYTKGIHLYPSEIHAIDCIAGMSAINMTDLSHQLGVTKGAVTKIITKLEKKGLVRRYKYINNQKEVFLHLTEKGLEAYNGHKAYHAAMNEKIDKYFCELSEEQGKEITNFLKLYLSEMQKLSDSTGVDLLES